MYRCVPPLALAVAIFQSAAMASAEPVPRTAPAAGAVIATKVGEEIEFVETPSFRGVEVLQDVKAGDVLRTNALGQLAILFSDQTQVRIGRNSALVVKERVVGGDTRLELQRGQIFARAARGGPGVFVETAAATAAIRGTDWTMRVDGERTTLTVLDGEVELANPQGSVIVRQGEAASATLGSAPTKIVIVQTDMREQMLIGLSLRGAFTSFPASAASGPKVRAAQARLAALPADRRTAEDSVAAAEIAADRDVPEVAAAALAQARSKRLTPALEARLTLLEAMRAGDDERYAEAVQLYDRALPGLTGERQTIALYQRYFARSLAEPTRVFEPPPPDGDDRISVVGQAITAAFLDSPKAGLAILVAAEPRFRDDAAYQATIAEAGLLAGDFDVARAAVGRAFALDPKDPEVLSARASFRARVDRDLAGARTDIEAALLAAPGNSDLYNDLGLLEDERGASREAEAAFRRAVELDPKDAVTLANLAVLLLDQGRTDEARVLIDRALAADPSFEVGHLARGRQQLQDGESDAAIDSILRATTANPGYSNGLLLLGAAEAGRGNVDGARQAFETADRLDPNDPVVAQYRALLAIDQYEADDAIRFATASVARTRARGGDYRAVEASRDSGSALGDAYRFLSLDAWGRYWGDRVFDPFEASGYFDQTLSGSVAPFFTTPGRELPGPDPVADDTAFSSLVQGLLIDPLALVGPNLRPGFIRTPFTEAEVGGGFTAAQASSGGNAAATFQSLGYDPLPYSLFVNATYEAIDPSFADEDERRFSGTAGFGLQATANDRLVGFFSASNAQGGASFERLPGTRSDTQDTEAYSGFVGWSHTFGHRNVLNAAVLGTSTERSAEDEAFGIFPAPDPLFDLRYDLESESRQRRLQGGISHLVGIGDDVVLRYGGEAGYSEERSRSAGDLFLPNIDPAARFRTCLTDVLATGGDAGSLLLLILDPTFRRERCPTDADDERAVGRVWLDATADVAPGLTVQGALFAENGLGGGSDEGGDLELSPRVGVAWAPAEGQYLRAAFLRTEPSAQLNTLAPVDVLGLRPDVLPSGTSRVDSAILRWDSVWTDRFFSAVEYQHQRAAELDLSVPAYLLPVTVPDARVDRLSVTGNLWIGGGFGAFATYAHVWSRGDLPGTEDRIPFVADDTARIGLTYVGPERLRLTLAQTYLGERSSNVAGYMLDEAFTTDLSGSWESEDRRLALEFGAFNLLGEEIEVAPLVSSTQRSVTATLKARF